MPHQHRQHHHRLDKSQLPPRLEEQIPELPLTSGPRPSVIVMGQETEVTLAQGRQIKKDLKQLTPV
jgi:hypothetical protein